MAGTIVVDRIESDASYASTINVAGQITFSNTVNFGVFAGTAPVAGFYLPATNTLAFTTASSERMRIDSSGNVGIGNTPSAKLDVTTGDGTATANAVYFRGTTGVFAIYPYFDATNGCLINSYNAAISAYKPMTLQASQFVWQPNGTERMRIDSSGNVLVGSASNPFNSKLYVTGTPTANAPIASFYSQGNSSTSGIGLYNDSASVGIWTSSGDLIFRTNGNLASGAETARITSAGLMQFNSGYGSAATAYGCRAWVNFNGTGTVAIRASGNVTSITDNGTGNYTVNFTTAMPDANHSTNVSGAAGTGPNGLRVYGLSSTLSASSVTVFSAYISSTGGSSTAEDEPLMCVAVFR
jgi:hypothetical protein